MRCSADIVPLGFEREKRQKKRLHERNINSTETQQFLNPLFTGYIDLKILERVSKRERERERVSEAPVFIAMKPTSTVPKSQPWGPEVVSNELHHYQPPPAIVRDKCLVETAWYISNLSLV